MSGCCIRLYPQCLAPNRKSVNICCLAVFAVPGLPVTFILWMLYLMRLQPVVCGCLWDVSFWGDRMRLSLCVCPCELSRCGFLSGQSVRECSSIRLKVEWIWRFPGRVCWKSEICARVFL